jgi:hypothetical protein
MTVSNRFWRSVTLLVRLDMALGVTMTAGMLIWMVWH